MAMITMSFGGRSNPRCRINQSREVISRPGTRQTIHKARVADNRTIATAQTAPLSLDKIEGFLFRRKKYGEWGVGKRSSILSTPHSPLPYLYLQERRQESKFAADLIAVSYDCLDSSARIFHD